MIRAAALALLPLPALAGDPVFRDLSRDLPVEHVYAGGWEHFVGGGVAVFDCNGDDRPDMVAAGGTSPMRLFVNRSEPGGSIAFTEGTGLAPLTGVTGAYPLDIDSDGWQDLVVLRVGPNAVLKGGQDCAFAPGPWAIDLSDRWTTSFSATWEAGNALPTLAFGNYVNRDDPKGPFRACDINQIARPEGEDYGPLTVLEPGYCALSMLFSDWQRRGTQDLRLSNDRHYYVKGGHEQMLRMPEMTFMGPDDAWQDISIWGMGIASEDLNGDGRPEVVLTSMADQLLQIATARGYEAAPYSTGTYAQRPFFGDDGRPSTGWHAEFGDVDNDGLSDLFIAKGNVDQMQSNAMKDPNNLLMQNQDGTFRETALAAGVATTERSRGAALVDLNLDGRLDLVVVNRRARMEVHQNVTEATGHWLALEPRQDGPNGFAIGGWVELRAGKLRLTRELTVGGGHAGGKAGPLHFGLGPATEAEVRVLWPDGTASDWTTLAANQRARLWRDGTALRVAP